jgi:hypothetical protein
MKRKWTFDPDGVDVDEGALTLVVVRRLGKRLTGYRIEVDAGVEEALRNICLKTLDRLRETEPEHFGPDVRIDREEYLAVPDVSLIVPSDEESQSDIETDVELRDILGRASSLERLSARDLPSGFLLYAVVVGDDATDRHAFVRKANPRSAVKPGRIVTAFGDRLQRIEQPLLVLDDHFDIVIGSGGLAALNQAVFDTTLPRYRGHDEAHSGVHEGAHHGPSVRRRRCRSDGRTLSSTTSVGQEAPRALREPPLEARKDYHQRCARRGQAPGFGSGDGHSRQQTRLRRRQPDHVA